MTKWEYKELNANWVNIENLGEEGWELIVYVPPIFEILNSRESKWIFKRPKV